MIAPVAILLALAVSPGTSLPLGAKLSERGIQISGLAWFQPRDTAQEPQLLFISQSVWSEWTILSAPRSAITAAIETSAPIEAQSVAVEAEPELDGFDGLEAAAVHGDEIYLLIEERFGKARLAHGDITTAEGQLKITLRPETIPLEPRNARPNLTCEALCMGDGNLWVFEEVSCASGDLPARAFEVFEGRHLSFAAINDRITDATPLDSAGRFWITAYEYRNEFGCDPPDPRSPERIIELQYADGGIKATGRAIDLNTGRPKDAPARNWEGIARWDNHHLLIINDDRPSLAPTTLLLVEVE